MGGKINNWLLYYIKSANDIPKCYFIEIRLDVFQFKDIDNESR